MDTTEEDRLILGVVDRLVERYPHVPPHTIAEITESIRKRFDGHPIRDYVPLFVERRAIATLAALPSTP